VRRPRRPRQDVVVLCVLGPSRNCSPTRHLGDGETVSRFFADRIARLGDRALIGVSDWQAGDRRTLTAVVGVVIAWRDPDGMVTMPVKVKPYVVIPAMLRRRCGLPPGGRHGAYYLSVADLEIPGSPSGDPSGAEVPKGIPPISCGWADVFGDTSGVGDPYMEIRDWSTAVQVFVGRNGSGKTRTAQAR